MSSRDLEQREAGEVAAFLDEVRRLPASPGQARGRLIMALDATASRQPTWNRAMAVQAQMFVEAERLGGLDVQLVFYRGFFECKASRWVANAAGLADLMAAVRCRAGQTQIARVLRHAATEAAKQPVRAMVFIGDAMEENIDELGRLAGELGLRGVKAFVFQERADAEAERAFRELARLTGGAWCRFDSTAPETLRDLLAGVAAYAAGGRPALEDAARRGGAGLRLLVHQVR